MNGQEVERLKRRFGTDIDKWPAPYRQEARMASRRADEVPAQGEDEWLDRLILESVGMETDDQALARKVRERIGRQRRQFFSFGPFAPSWQLPAVAAGFAAILFAAGIAGYSAAKPDYERMDDAMLALALGDPAVSGLEPSLLGHDPVAGDGKEDLL
jgi:hypothetical protein